MATESDYAEFEAFKAWQAAQATGAATSPESPLVPETVVPVTEHPAYAEVTELLSALHLEGAENTFRNVYSWLDAHFTKIVEDAPKVEADVEPVLKDVTTVVTDAGKLL